MKGVVKPKGFFVTGTDTAVGKTLITAALLLNARAFGLRAGGVKPVSAGCERVNGRLVNGDALVLQHYSSIPLDYSQVNPVALEPAIAPHIAARRAGLGLRADTLAAAVADVADQGHDVLLVEGAGGWLVPLNDTQTMADVAVQLKYPVILVIAMRLGCLNHALLTAQAIQSTGLSFAGWVANSTAPAMEAFDENLRALEQRLPALRLGTVPYLGKTVTPEQVNTWLDGMSLLVSPDLPLIIAAAFGAGLVDAMVGGGGLIQLPALLTTYPATAPAILLGTNKFASIFGTSTAVLRFARGVRIPWRTLLPLVPVVFLGALGGARVAALVPPEVFRPLVPVMLAAVLVYIVWRKNLGAEHAPRSMSRASIVFATVVLGAVGFYDGFFGPGTGSFFMFMLVRLFGFDFLHSAASARVLNMATNAGALLYFGTQLDLLWLVAVLMAVANVSGAVIGTGLALKHGSAFVRRIFIGVVVVLIARTTWDAYFAS